MQLSIFFLAPRKATYDNSRFLFALFALRSGLSVRFPVPFPFAPLHRLTLPNKSLVGSNGLGPSTSRLSGVCSNQLSYEPLLVEVIGFEPMTPCLQGRCSTN